MSVRLFCKLAAIMLLPLLASCSDMLFYPEQRFYLTPDQVGVDYDSLYIESADKTRLHGWLLKTSEVKRGNVLYLHGNGQNISTHFTNMYWLTEYGYDAYIFDYRGYGLSQGEVDLDGAIEDVAAMLDYILAQSEAGEQLVVIGHSLGGAFSVYSVATHEHKNRISGLVTINAFSDYHAIAQDVLARSWLTWLFQVPLSWTIDNSYSPVKVADEVAPVPLLVMYGSRDVLIDPAHSKQLFKAAGEPRLLLEIDSDHNHIFNSELNKKALIDYLDGL